MLTFWTSKFSPIFTSKSSLSWGWGEDQKKWCCANQVGEVLRWKANLEERMILSGIIFLVLVGWKGVTCFCCVNPLIYWGARSKDTVLYIYIYILIILYVSDYVHIYISCKSKDVNWCNIGVMNMTWRKKNMVFTLISAHRTWLRSLVMTSYLRLAGKGQNGKLPKWSNTFCWRRSIMIHLGEYYDFSRYIGGTCFSNKGWECNYNPNHLISSGEWR